MSPTAVWRPLLGCAVATFLAGCASQPVRNVAALNQATVLIEHAKGHGTGAIIGPNQVLTAYHVVADEPVQVEFFDGPKVGAKVRWYDEALDLALIDVAVPPGYRASELACHRLSTGQHLVAVGHPMRDRWVPRDGRLPRTDPVGGSGLVPLGFDIGLGTSGGPVFDDTGRIAGIALAI